MRQQRQPRERRQKPSGLEALSAFGLMGQDPVKNLGGIVSLLQGLQEPQLKQEEMGLRWAGLDQDASQFDQRMGMDQQQFDQRERFEQDSAGRWNQDFNQRGELAKQARLDTMTKFEYDQEEDKRRLGLALLGLPYQYNQAGIGNDPMAMLPLLEGFGIGGFLNEPKGKPLYGGIQLNADQEIQSAARQKRFPTQ